MGWNTRQTMVIGVGRDACHCQHVHFTQVAVYLAVKPLACYIDLWCPFHCQCLKLLSMSSLFLHGVLHKHRDNLRCDSYVPTKPSCKLYLITYTPVVPLSSEWVLLHINMLSESVISSVCDIAGIPFLESCSGWLLHSWVLFVCWFLSSVGQKNQFFFGRPITGRASPNVGVSGRLQI